MVSDIFFFAEFTISSFDSYLLLLKTVNISSNCRLLKAVITFGFRSDQINYVREKPKSNNWKIVKAWQGYLHGQMANLRVCLDILNLDDLIHQFLVSYHNLYFRVSFSEQFLTFLVLHQHLWYLKKVIRKDSIIESYFVLCHFVSFCVDSCHHVSIHVQ